MKGTAGTAMSDGPRVTNKRKSINAVRIEVGMVRKRSTDEVIFLDASAIVKRNTPDGFFLNPREERSRLFLSQILR